jgi:hypothetical protein
MITLMREAMIAMLHLPVSLPQAPPSARHALLDPSPPRLVCTPPNPAGAVVGAARTMVALACEGLLVDSVLQLNGYFSDSHLRILTLNTWSP